jgi:hypothetical protein
MVEVLIEEMFGSTEAGRKITSEPWSSMQRSTKNKEDHSSE